MHREDIKAELRKRFGSIRAFEGRCGLAPQSVNDVLRGRASKKAAEAIANGLNLPISIVFPGRFPSSGEVTPEKSDAHRLNASAA